MQIRHAVAIAAAVLATTAGSAFAADLVTVKSRVFHEYQNRYWNGNDIPSHLVTFGRSVRSGTEPVQFGRAAPGGIARSGDKPTHSRLDLDVSAFGRA